MARRLDQTLTPEKGLIFRITHRSNLPWIFQNGLHASASSLQDPEFVGIGNPDLIDRRRQRQVPIPPGGTLADYIPFYFTPFTPMLYNIHTGYGGIRRHRNDEIVILASSVLDLEKLGIRYVFTDRHAYLQRAAFFSDRANLEHIDYDLLRRRDFQRDPEDPEKVERYQAEALVYRHLPLSAVRGLVCYTELARREIGTAMKAYGVEVAVFVRPGWYFG